jgi:hypothetical protein
LVNLNNTRLIVIARRNNHEHIRNIFGTLRNRIEFIEDYFGEERFIDNLENLLISLPISN